MPRAYLGVRRHIIILMFLAAAVVATTAVVESILQSHGLFRNVDRNHLGKIYKVKFISVSERVGVIYRFIVEGGHLGKINLCGGVGVGLDLYPVSYSLGQWRPVFVVGGWVGGYGGWVGCVVLRGCGGLD